MGVDCEVKLPPGVRIADVSKVLAILNGAKVEKRFFETDERFFETGERWDVYVPSLEFYGARVGPTCTDITWINGKQVACSQRYHFEFDNIGSRGMVGRSCAPWIATCRRLVDFFGGSVDYQDCDGSFYDYVRESPSDYNAENGDEWYSLQERILNCQPLTDEEIAACNEFAAYKE